MDIQDLRIDRFLIEVQDVYKNVSSLFRELSTNIIRSRQYEAIRDAFYREMLCLPDHIKIGRFVSEESRQKVLSDLRKAEELISDAKPDRIFFLDEDISTQSSVTKMIDKINTMSVDDV